MNASASQPNRVRVDGKFFRLGGKKFYIKGITYGPFAPNTAGEHFAPPEQTRRDFELIQELGANVIRVYYVPPRWLLDIAEEAQLKVFIDIPWPKHLCFMDSDEAQQDARRTVRQAVEATKRHPAVLAYSVVNEIAPDVVRWSGVDRVNDFIDSLVAEAKAVDPDCLCTFTSFPPTEYLRPQEIDFHCFNVYLHHARSLSAYLARLQTLADSRPLMLGEFGMDSIREGEEHKCKFLKEQIETTFRAGLAGTVVFSFTDDWFRGGMQIEDWGFGLTTRDRQRKDSFAAVREQFQISPYFPLPRTPRISVVVATHNGARTLPACLTALTKLNYADYEVILVDDGSTDATPQIAAQFPAVRHVRQGNQGLSAARNAGVRAATGEIVAFTDDDCRPDEDWLYYLTADLLASNFAGIGGHNFLPPEDSCVAAAVLVSPGGPAHVMLTDHEAEHIPGCNMAFYKWALEQIGLFDHQFRKAGDDVDICWRLQDAGLKLGFSHAGFVWHYRRSTVKAYLKQQTGYGEAEAMLYAKHPEHYSSLGGGIWLGRIYASSFSGLLLQRPVIYHGIFASGHFQRLYSRDPVSFALYSSTLGYHLAVNLPLLILGFNFPAFEPLAWASWLLSIGTCGLAAAQARIPRSKRRFWSRPLVALLFLLQPVYRGWARTKGRLKNRSAFQFHPPEGKRRTEVAPNPLLSAYWSSGAIDRFQFLGAIVQNLDRNRMSADLDSGWTSHDIVISPRSWNTVRFTTVTEDLEGGKRSIRCRISSHWSYLAIMLLVAMLLCSATLIYLFADSFPWVWFSMLLVPLALWAVEDEAELNRVALQSLVAHTAKSLSLVELKK